MTSSTNDLGTLVLSARAGNSIIIGDETVVVKVTRIKDDTVWLRFTADKTIPIHRHKIYEKIQKEGNTK